MCVSPPPCPLPDRLVESVYSEIEKAIGKEEIRRIAVLKNVIFFFNMSETRHVLHFLKGGSIRNHEGECKWKGLSSIE